MFLLSFVLRRNDRAEEEKWRWDKDSILDFRFSIKEPTRWPWAIGTQQGKVGLRS